jgi:hypothetical protein
MLSYLGASHYEHEEDSAEAALQMITLFGYPVSWVLAEDEKFLFEIGWEPYHVEKGFDKNVSTVTGCCSTMWGQNNIPATSDATIVMQLIAREMTYKEGLASGSLGSARTELITPPVAKVLADGGYTKKSLKEDLVKTARIGAFEYNWHRVYGSFGRVYPPFEKTLAEFLASPAAEKGRLPPWYPEFPGWEEFVTTPSLQAGKVEILVCGDRSRNKTQTMASTHQRNKTAGELGCTDEEAGLSAAKEFLPVTKGDFLIAEDFLIK